MSLKQKWSDKKNKNLLKNASIRHPYSVFAVALKTKSIIKINDTSLQTQDSNFETLQSELHSLMPCHIGIAGVQLIELLNMLTLIQFKFSLEVVSRYRNPQILQVAEK